MGEILQGFFVVCIEVLCCKIFFEIFLEKREYRHKYIRIVLVTGLISILGVGTLALFNHMVLKEVFVLTAFFVFVLLYFETTWFKALFFAVIFVGILLAVDYFASIVLIYLLPSQYAWYLDNLVISTLILFLCKMLLFAIILLIKRIWITKNPLNVITRTEWVKFAFVPVLTVLSILAFIVGFPEVHRKQEAYTILLISFGLVIMNILVFYLMQEIVTREVTIQQDNVFRERMKGQTQMYYAISENFEKQRKRAHEYKNHIGCIEGLLSEHKEEEALKYVKKLTGNLKKDMDAIDTNHVIVNAVLNTKYAEAGEKGIVMSFQINDLSQLIISDEDIVTIISNLLSNAIEACEKNHQRKVIWFKFIEEKELTIVSVKNTTEQQVQECRGELMTSKPDTVNHGVGITNIQETVRKYGGSCSWRQEKDCFQFSVVIPHAEQNSDL